MGRAIKSNRNKGITLKHEQLKQLYRMIVDFEIDSLEDLYLRIMVKGKLAQLAQKIHGRLFQPKPNYNFNFSDQEKVCILIIIEHNQNDHPYITALCHTVYMCLSPSIS